MANQPRPLKNVSYDIDFFIYKTDGTIITNPGGLAGRIVCDPHNTGAVTDNSPSVIDSTGGLCRLTISQAEMNGNYVSLKVTSTDSGAIPFTAILCPAEEDLTTATISSALWNALSSGMTTTGSIGKRIVDYITGDIFARIGAPQGASVSADISTLTGVVSEGIPHYYAPNSSSDIVYGTVGSGTYASLASRDDTLLQLNEVAGTDPLEYVCEFSGITAGHILSELSVTGRYEGNTNGHQVDVFVWNYLMNAWVKKFSMLNRTTNFDYAAGLLADSVNVSGLARVKFAHSAVTGSGTHRLYLDRVQLSAVEATNQSAAVISSILSLTQDIDDEVYAIHGKLPATTIASQADVQAVQAPTFTGTVEFNGTIQNNVTADVEISQEGLDEIVSAVSEITTSQMSTDIVDKISTQLVFHDSISLGQGTGSIEWPDRLLNATHPVRNVVVRAFNTSLVGQVIVVDWYRPIARSKTNQNGEYTLYLDPGTYVLSYELGGTQVSTKTIVVDDL